MKIANMILKKIYTLQIIFFETRSQHWYKLFLNEENYISHIRNIFPLLSDSNSSHKLEISIQYIKHVKLLNEYQQYYYGCLSKKNKIVDKLQNLGG